MQLKIFTALIVGLPLMTSAIGQTIYVHSYADASCGTWVKSEGDLGERSQYTSWLRGFVSGYNYGNPSNQVRIDRMPDTKTLHLFVDKYCRENPLKPFVSAAFRLVEEIREHPEIRRDSAR